MVYSSTSGVEQEKTNSGLGTLFPYWPEPRVLGPSHRSRCSRPSCWFGLTVALLSGSGSIFFRNLDVAFLEIGGVVWLVLVSKLEGREGIHSLHSGLV